MNVLAVLEDKPQGHPKGAFECSAEMRRVRKTRFVGSVGEGVSLHCQLDRLDHSQPEKITAERNADLFGEEMDQAAFGEGDLSGYHSGRNHFEG